ncbi:MAG TPA: (2Fe-2S) ferredoxin domain-containing protein [Caldisericia bacterium]|nr:(2Fe-2S) ferredoxin domain-containing protein [Caldisericia bacterium]HOL82755.1 (2Fe-2S) ferredoxin domain-containing protein [Caldisericia bacterium]HON83121.1 (2Fe-2S) ferredoxin domain-containing protein [Caldisericia bacterium]HPC57101.1 (2Fe-2S) ferredoxin domain-containing protein [Caldisericia bacterium]HPP44092.1 (2Fe-2S) ferredoxin domain-containing protein [Caldisericia bacterium]
MKVEDLRKLREKVQKEMELRKGKARVNIVVGMGTSGIAAGAREVLKTLIDEIEKRNLTDVIISQTGEKDFPSKEPFVIVKEEGKPDTIYGNVSPDIARRIIVEHIINGNQISDYIIKI